MQPISARWVGRHLAVFTFYLLAAALILNRLMFDLGGLVPTGPLSDYHLFTWNYWWLDHALFRLHTDPYLTNYILYPQTHNLAAHTLAPILFPAHRLLYPLLGNPASLNVILWLSFALAGYVAFLFLRRFCSGMVFPLLGGTLYAFSPAMFDHAANYHANMWLMCWLPGMVLLWERVARTRRTVWALIFGFVLWAVLLTDPQFLIWLPFLLIPYGLLTLIHAARNRARVRLAALGMIALAVCGLLSLIAPLPAMLRGGLGGTSPARYLTARAYSLPISALVGIPGGADRSIGRVVPGLAAAGILLSAGRGLARRLRLGRQAQGTKPLDDSAPEAGGFWLLIALPPLIFALGPEIEVGGSLVPLPYRLLHDALGGLYRFPSRFAPVGVLALLAYIGLSLRPLFIARRGPRYAAVVALTLLIALDTRLFAPFPTQSPLPDYQIYHGIAAEPGDFVILDVPVTVHSGWLQIGGSEGHRTMWYQTIHGKRQVNGSISRIPDVDHLYFQQNPLLGWLSGSREADLPAASAELAEFARAWPLGYVLVHLNWLDPAASLPILGFLNTHPALCFSAQERDLIAYRARALGCPPPPASLSIDFGAGGDEPYLVAGWYPRENIGGPVGRWARQSAALTLRLASGRDYTLEFEALGFGPGQRLAVAINDQEVGLVDLPNAWTAHSLRLPARLVPPDGELALTLSAARESQPAGSDTRLLAAAFRWLRIH